MCEQGICAYICVGHSPIHVYIGPRGQLLVSLSLSTVFLFVIVVLIIENFFLHIIFSNQFFFPHLLPDSSHLPTLPTSHLLFLSLKKIKKRQTDKNKTNKHKNSKNTSEFFARRSLTESRAVHFKYLH